MFSRTRLTLHRSQQRRFPRPASHGYLARFGLVLLIALIFTAADAFSAEIGSDRHIPQAEKAGV